MPNLSERQAEELPKSSDMLVWDSPLLCANYEYGTVPTYFLFAVISPKAVQLNTIIVKLIAAVFNISIF